MPQMMPMLWSIMMIFMILLVISMVSFFYSMVIPPSSNLSPYKSSSYLTMPQMSNWSWKW